MSEQELRRHRCCFTGHRPERLGMPETEAIFGLKKEIRAAIADGFQTFISGMARGVDLWAAEIVLALRDEGAVVRLICASPYRGFESRWSLEWQERYRRIISSPIWCDSFALVTAGIVSSGEMSGWLTTLRGLSPSIMASPAGHGIR